MGGAKKGGVGRRGTKTRAEVAVEQSFVLHEHDVNGRNFEWCAAALGLSVGTVHGRYRAACKELIGEDAESLVQAHARRLEALVDKAMWLVQDNDPKIALMAIDRVVRISESTRKLLGLDQPTQTVTQLSVTTPTDLAIDQLISQHEGAILRRERVLKAEQRAKLPVMSQAQMMAALAEPALAEAVDDAIAGSVVETVVDTDPQP